MRVRSEDDLFSDDFTPVEQAVVEQPTPQPAPQAPPRGREDEGRGRGQARARGRAGRARGGALTGSQPQNTQQNGQTPVQQEAAPVDAPTGPRKESASVRGDRQGTGGVRKPKLTEDELAEKMAKIHVKNASLTAAHARAEADAASFAEREEQAKTHAVQRQKEERRDRQQMMGERERNRMRKLKAMEGREWDAEKNEDDFSRGGRSDKKGSFAGDKEDYTDGREYLYREPKGQRGGRGGGRGGRAHEPVAPKREEFPALPAAPKPITKSQQSKDAAADGNGGVNSWADQVESSSPS